MKLALQKSPIPASQAFVVKYLKEAHFDANWHFHPEYQLFVVLRGSGTRFIGDQVKPFREGDMVFIGPNLPHLWRSDAEYFEGRADYWTEGIVVYFQEDFLGNAFLQKEEMHRVKHLFQMACRGVDVVGSTAEKVKSLLRQLLKLDGFDKVLQFLQILHVLAQANCCQPIASLGYTNTLKASDTERMNKVHAYVMKNFKSSISLEEAATIANMAPASFSRYFKTHANKTFSGFVCEIRIGHACKLLVETNLTVSQACYECGFQTLSNFNRQFKAFTGRTPKAYKKEFAEPLLI
ncbi:AraC family transcriptional regulator [Pontibacter ummariensis]|uniref:Transcriptional regulator, AraC family n=1 Tax=Pontibacter ummariensis TaxID=1610492 RepID=A0A239KDQ5_9BACT|nr:AraC family transcriptional regulator [Pontibacter ummariensis]PRY06395.1 AraC family transcriptional regulator [Pontibacter ummariensis]SNT16496.1 transcriptional regulator, AraC family [Pontibacter ummariensis]